MSFGYHLDVICMSLFLTFSLSLNISSSQYWIRGFYEPGACRESALARVFAAEQI